MLYQVMYRLPNREWREYGSPLEGYSLGWTKSQCQANYPSAEVVVVEGTTHTSLRDAVARQATLPAPDLDLRREKLEEGPGGDHDEPYRYRSPDGPWLAKLLPLFRKVQTGELEP